MAEARRARKHTKTGPMKTAAEAGATKATVKTGTKKVAARKAAPVVKKRAVKQKAKAARANDPNFKPLKKKEIEAFRLRLLDMRQQLVGDVDHMRAEALKDSLQESSGDLSSMPIHMADIGTDNYEQEFTLGLIESDRKMLKEIDLALNRISDGDYGVCEATHVAIGRARLQAKPYARYCIDYARKVEEGLVSPGEETEEEGVVD